MDRMPMWRGVIAAGLALCLAGPLAAQSGESWCYERIYSNDHLADNPAQVVWQIRLKVLGANAQGGRDILLETIAANQGHARNNDNHGRVLSQTLSCRQSGGSTQCQAQCDAGGFEVTRMNINLLTFETRFLLVGEDECGGRMDLAEVPGEAVKYRLDRVDDAICGNM